MLRIYARILAAVLGVIAIAAVRRMTGAGLLGAGLLGAGLGAGVLYLGSAAIFAYAGFWLRKAATIRIVVAAMGSLFLLLGLLVAGAMSILGFPFEGRGWVVGLAHAAFGGLTMACAVLLPCDDE
jgi:hypothetical protein